MYRAIFQTWKKYLAEEEEKEEKGEKKEEKEKGRKNNHSVSHTTKILKKSC